MASIYLIRHGQASWGASDYDQLSELGFEQSRMLGEYWQQMPMPDRCYSGALLRHGQTADSFFQGFQNSQVLNSHSGFNEFDHVDILRAYNADWADPKAFRQHLKRQPNPARSFLHEFSNAFDRWLGGEHDDYAESFQVFRHRSLKALKDVITQVKLQHQANADSRIENILVFTSGGVISAICSELLAIPDERLLTLNMQLVNTSVTRLLFNDDQITLDYVNNYGHLLQAGDRIITRK